jgi:serine/threonine protein kinase
MRNGAMSEAEVLHQTTRLLTVLQTIHSGKPAHFLQVPTLSDILVPDDGQWLLLPFVLMRNLGTDASPYRAPELPQTRSATPASDVYALSAIAYHASTGVAPLTAEQIALGARFITPRTHVPALSDMWEAVLTRGLQDKPSNRYQHAAEMLAAFDRRRRVIVSELNKIPGVVTPNPKGAFYVYPDVTGLLGKTWGGVTPATSLELADLILDQAEVAAVPGEAFGPSGYLRFSYALGDGPLLEGVQRLQKLFA